MRASPFACSVSPRLVRARRTKHRVFSSLSLATRAQALLVIPKTLAINAACDATELVAKLRADHHRAQLEKDPAKCLDLSAAGLDLRTGVIHNCLAAGVIEPSMSKAKSISFATEAAITILRIDDMIKLAEKPPPGQGGGMM